MANYIAVRVDQENSGDVWWSFLRDRYPNFARSLEKNGVAVIEESLWKELAYKSPRFWDGPEYAPTPLIDCGSDGPQWEEVIVKRHQVFNRLR